MASPSPSPPLFPPPGESPSSRGPSAIQFLEIAVLVNDSPASLLFAARLALSLSNGACRVRASIGGKAAASLIHDKGSLHVLSATRGVVELPTRILKRSLPPSEAENKSSTSAEDELAKGEPGVLWLCDWKDQATAWYALSECHVIIQATKASDSKTVAMWLVEVCREDAVIISLQSGLHNVRELRAQFGRREAWDDFARGEGATGSLDMPLIVPERNNLTDRKRNASMESFATRDTPAASMSSTPSDDYPVNEGSPTPPLPLLRATASSVAEAARSSNLSASSVGRSPTSNHVANGSSGGAGSKVLDEARYIPPEETAPASDHGIKPRVVILAGVLGFSASIASDGKKLVVAQSTYAPLVIERLRRQDANVLGLILLLERAGFPICYRGAEQTNNFLWGDLVWRTFDSYAAAVQLQRCAKKLSMLPDLYGFLSYSETSEPRRVFAALIAEAHEALQYQRVELMDPVTSPFPNLSFWSAQQLLLLPDGFFQLALKLVITVGGYAAYNSSPLPPESVSFCALTPLHRALAPYLNGEVVRVGFEASVPTPLNLELMEAVARIMADPAEANSPSFQIVSDKSLLPELIPVSKVLGYVSVFVGAFSVFLALFAFMIRVVLYW